jgi:DNA-binding response OmpR family regulator
VTKKILVADDDPAILHSLQMLLEDEGYQVETTVDGATIGDAQGFRPDLILLDIWMSGMDGREICRQLKSRDNTKGIPIVMISANRDTEQIARQAGADDFIAKPFDIDELLVKVEQAI